MDAAIEDDARKAGWLQKALILIAVAAVYASSWWPTNPLRVAGLRGLGLTNYERWGILVPHLLFYSTIMAALSAAFWVPMAKAGWLPFPPLGNVRRSIVPGVIAGLIAVVATLATAFAFFPAGTVHWIDPNPWKIAGNIFSNFYEEFVWRGFLLFGLREIVGFWPAAIISSASWGFLHTQYPLAGQLIIVGTGIGFSWLVRSTSSLWAPYVAHEVVDVIGDSLVG